jgi:hypothetical protein
MRLEHAIFKGPLAVELETEEVDTPAGYRPYPGGDALPPKLSVWKVQTRTYPSIDPGLVSDPYGFEDSPDCEWISSGVNSKGPRSMAIGRQGNLFLWGFFAQPSDMTESARRVFVNSIAYMKQFDGARPIGGGASMARDWILVCAGHVESLGADPKNEDMLRSMFPARVLESTGLDAARLRAYFRENLEMLHPVRVNDPRGGSSSRTVIDVDDDLKALGVGNRSPQFVPKLIERLERDPKDALSAALAGRYLEIAPSLEPAKLRAWYEENEPYLFFSDRLGFRWWIDERKKSAKTASK